MNKTVLHKPRRLLVRALAAVWAFGVLSVSAQSDMDAVLDGFDDMPTYEDVIELPQEPSDDAFSQSAWKLHGSLGLAASYNLVDHASTSGTDYAGLSKLRGRGQLGLELNLGATWRAELEVSGWHDFAYDLRDAQYSPEVLAAYENEVDLPQARVSGPLAQRWDLSLGRQVAVLGFADQLRVLDVLNPLDNLEPGLADVEDLRLAVAMLRLDRHGEQWQLSGFVTPEQRFSRNPPYGSDFYSLVDANGEAMRLREITPDSVDNIDGAVALTGRFTGWDLSLMASHHWHDEPYLDARAVDYSNPNSSEDDFQRDAVLRHARIWQAGFGFQRSLGSWLIKQEAAWLNGLKYTTSGPVQMPLAQLPLVGSLLGSDDQLMAPMGVREGNEVHGLLGLEYYGLAYTSISLEISARQIQDFDSSLAASGYRRWRGETALRITRDLFKERLRLHAIAVWLRDEVEPWQADGGAIYRVNGEYDFGSGLVASGGVLLYQSGHQPPLTVSGDNDRLFADIKWSF